jgi:hypothetical protein
VEKLACDSIVYRRQWTLTDGRPAVFKTVCGALLRRPGWVRFPSIPASLAAMTAKVTATSARVGDALGTMADAPSTGASGPSLIVIRSILVTCLAISSFVFQVTGASLPCNFTATGSVSQV